MITRAHILRVLEGELNALEDREMEDNDANALHQVLLVLIEALESLDEGEVHPLFARTKVKTWGKKPATVRKLRLHAIGAVAALRKAGCLAHEAIWLVADAYAVNCETIRKWRKTLGKDMEDTNAQMIKGLWVSEFKRSIGPRMASLGSSKRKGEEFKKAQVKKAQVKKGEIIPV